LHGLCDAVITIPAEQPISLTAYERQGVGIGSGKIYVFIPLAANTLAAVTLNRSDLIRLS
jgi:hypothetical protein